MLSCRCFLGFSGAQHIAERYRSEIGGRDILELRETAAISGDSSGEDQIAAVLANANEKYDFILIDTCALSRRNRRNLDPILLARRADGAILLIRL